MIKREETDGWISDARMAKQREKKDEEGEEEEEESR